MKHILGVITGVAIFGLLIMGFIGIANSLSLFSSWLDTTKTQASEPRVPNRTQPEFVPLPSLVDLETDSTEYKIAEIVQAHQEEEHDLFWARQRLFDTYQKEVDRCQNNVDRIQSQQGTLVYKISDITTKLTNATLAQNFTLADSLQVEYRKAKVKFDSLEPNYQVAKYRLDNALAAFNLWHERTYAK